MQKRISSSVFGLILLSFLLPWTTVSCEQQPVMSLTGVQLVTGTTFKQPVTMFSEAKEEKVPGEVLALGAAIAAVIGVCAVFFSLVPSTIIASGAAVLYAILTIVLKIKLDKGIFAQGEGMLQISYGFGFYGSLVLSFCLLAANLYVFNTNRGNASLRGYSISGEDPS